MTLRVRAARPVVALVGALVACAVTVLPASASTVPDRAPALAAPAAVAVGSCFDYPIATVGRVSSPAPAVPCDSPHTAETFSVGTLGENFGPPSKASVAARLMAARPCTVSAMNAYLGLSGRPIPSRFMPVALLPTDEQWAAGERWARCDVVLQTGLQLQQLTTPVAAFIAATPAASLDFCTPSTPSARNKAAIICSNPRKNWIKVLERDLGGPTARYPGDSTVMRRSAVICQKVAKQYNGKVPFPGWWRINPTRDGWEKLGKRSVQCFVPYAQYLAELAQRAPAPAPSPSPTPTA